MAVSLCVLNLNDFFEQAIRLCLLSYCSLYLSCPLMQPHVGYDETAGRPGYEPWNQSFGLFLSVYLLVLVAVMRNLDRNENADNWLCALFLCEL